MAAMSHHIQYEPCESRSSMYLGNQVLPSPEARRSELGASDAPPVDSICEGACSRTCRKNEPLGTSRPRRKGA